MKKSLLIIALFIGLGNVNAQDASNDATWEETIEFINENLQYANGQDNDFSIIEDIYLKENKIFVYYASESGRKKKNILPLNKIKSADDWDTHCAIWFTGNYSISEYTKSNGEKDSTYKTNNGELYFEKELRLRMIKAFNHIAYLNSEKKKKSKF
jgi:hypothetical protein